MQGYRDSRYIKRRYQAARRWNGRRRSRREGRKMR